MSDTPSATTRLAVTVHGGREVLTLSRAPVWRTGYQAADVSKLWSVWDFREIFQVFTHFPEKCALPRPRDHHIKGMHHRPAPLMSHILPIFSCFRRFRLYSLFSPFRPTACNILTSIKCLTVQANGF